MSLQLPKTGGTNLDLSPSISASSADQVGKADGKGRPETAIHRRFFGNP
jgi:hypothetical protein